MPTETEKVSRENIQNNVILDSLIVSNWLVSLKSQNSKQDIHKILCLKYISLSLDQNSDQVELLFN